MNKISLLTSLLVALPSFAANYPDALRGNYVENSNADSRACDNPYLTVENDLRYNFAYAECRPVKISGTPEKYVIDEKCEREDAHWQQRSTFEANGAKLALMESSAIHDTHTDILRKCGSANQPVSGSTCKAGAETLFFCLTTKGKRIQLCDEGKTLEYSFGPPEKQPEIVVRVPRAKASTTQWQGVGRYKSESVDIPNGKTTYSVFFGADLVSDEHPIEAGVNVLVNGEHKATVKCGDERTLINNLEGVELKPTE